MRRLLPLVGLIIPVLSSGQIMQVLPLSERYILRSWDTDHGLPHSRVSGVTQTPDGYLWLATSLGLVRFDGVRFTVFDHENTSALESSDVNKVRSMRNGELWIGLERGGIVRLVDGKFERISGIQAGQGGNVTSFAEEASGAIWAGFATVPKVMRWRDGKMEIFTKQDGVGAAGDALVRVDAEGKVWCGTKSGLSLFDGERFHPVDPELGDRVQLTRHSKGGVWVARGRQLLHYRAGEAPVRMGELAVIGGSGEVTALHEDREGGVWVGTRTKGLLRFKRGAFEQVAVSHLSVQAIFEDREGNIWVGTRAGGLDRLRATRFHLLGAGGPQRVESIVEDRQQRLWIAIQDGAPLINGVPVENWRLASTTCLCADPKSGVWIGSDGGGVRRWKDGTLTELGMKPRVANLLADRQMRLWIATLTNELFRWDTQDETHSMLTVGVKGVRALAEDAAGTVWAGTEEGTLYREEGGRLRQVVLPGVASPIRFLTPDGNSLWIGTATNGLFRWRDGVVDRLHDESGLSQWDFRSLLLDRQGGAWLAVGHHLFRTTQETLHAVVDGDARTLDLERFGRDDGLRDPGFGFGRRQAVLAGHDGMLWFATDRGALRVDPSLQEPRTPPPPVVIEEVTLEGAVLPWRSVTELRLPPHPGTLKIAFTSPSFCSPELMRFRYRLVGTDADWTAVEGQRAASYPRLPPGSYRFEASVASEGGAWSAPTALPPILVGTAWWESWWFMAVLVMGGGVGIGLGVRILLRRRYRARMQKLEAAHALERERARIARDMHDDLGANLTRIALISELATLEPEVEGVAAVKLGEIAQTARSVSSALDQIVWTVNPRNDTLERLIGYLAEYVTEYLEPTGIALHLSLPSQIPDQPVASDTRHQILLTLKEALNNASKHAGATEIHLRLKIEGHSLCIELEDNGCGFDPNAIPVMSNGLGNMRQRIAALRGSLGLQTAPGAGCKLTFTLPIA